MGYTHYFKLKKDEQSLEQFQKVLDDAKIIMANLPEHSESAGGFYPNDPIVIRGGSGEGEPVFSMKEGIWVNGDGEGTKDLSHETFMVTPHRDCSDFCKTERKPYDFVVCCLLLSLKKRMNNFTYTSDGKEADWKPATDFFNKHIKN